MGMEELTKVGIKQYLAREQIKYFQDLIELCRKDYLFLSKFDPISLPESRLEMKRLEEYADNHKESIRQIITGTYIAD